MLDASRTEDRKEGRGHAVASGEQTQRLLPLGEQTRKLRESGERTLKPLVWEEQTHKHRWAAEAALSRI